MSEVRPLNILWAEDNPNDVTRARIALKNIGHSGEVMFVQDGKQVLAFLMREGEYVGAFRPDLIISDINMPWMNGLELLEALKKDDDLWEIPFVLMNISERAVDIRQAYRSGAAGYFITPVDCHDLDGVLKPILDYWSVSLKPGDGVTQEQMDARFYGHQ